MDRPSLLIVDDDETFCEVLARAMVKRGFDTTCMHDIKTALEQAEVLMPEYAIIDLKLGNESGLLLVEKIRELDPGTRIIVLTGYASIATAVEAIKLGPPTTWQNRWMRMTSWRHSSARVEILKPLSAPHPLSVERLEWEYIHRILMENDNNVSVTAKVLNMHRRTLQRKLSKKPAQL